MYDITFLDKIMDDFFIIEVSLIICPNEVNFIDFYCGLRISASRFKHYFGCFSHCVIGCLASRIDIIVMNLYKAFAEKQTDANFCTRLLIRNRRERLLG